MSKVKNWFDKAFAVDNSEEEENTGDKKEMEKKPNNSPVVSTNTSTNKTSSPTYKTYQTSESTNKSTYTKSNLVRMNNNTNAKVHTFEPKSLDDAKKVIEYLNNNYAVLLNLENSDSSLSQRIVDVVTGALYLLDGDYTVVTQDIYLLAPKGIEITSPLTAENTVDNNIEKSAKSNSFKFKK